MDEDAFKVMAGSPALFGLFFIGCNRDVDYYGVELMDSALGEGNTGGASNQRR